MGISLGHDWRLMPQDPLDLIQIHPGLNHSRCARMAQIMEMEILDLARFECACESPSNIRSIEGGSCLAVKDQISFLVSFRMLMLQERQAPSVIGIVRRSPFFERKTVTVRRNRSTPAHVSAVISPIRMPVLSANTTTSRNHGGQHRAIASPLLRVNQRSRVLFSLSIETRHTGLSVHHSHSRRARLNAFFRVVSSRLIVAGFTPSANRLFLYVTICFGVM